MSEEARIEVKSFGHNVYVFTWQGPPEGFVRISQQLAELRPFMGLIPWPLREVGRDLAGNGLYRRTG